MKNKAELEGVTRTKVAITLAIAAELFLFVVTNPEIFTIN